MLTNDIVSFEQLGHDYFQIYHNSREINIAASLSSTICYVNPGPAEPGYVQSLQTV